MDGSSAAFRLDSPLFSGLKGNDDCGILYIEDFDTQSEAGLGQDVTQTCVEAPTLLFTSIDIEAAREAGRAEGMRAALTDARLIQDQLNEASVQSLTESLRTEHAMLERVANRYAADGLRIMMATLQAAIPSVMAQHAICEAKAVLQAILPGLSYEPELRVCASPTLTDALRETLAECLPGDTTVLSIVADPNLVVGDVHVTWQDGQAQRNCASIWNAIRAALIPLGLPSAEGDCLVQ